MTHVVISHWPTLAISLTGDYSVWEVICVFYVDDHRMDVWVMKEHGLGESWNLVISVPLCNFGRPWPIFIFQNDEVLLKDGSRLVYIYIIRRTTVSRLILRFRSSFVSGVNFICTLKASFRQIHWWNLKSWESMSEGWKFVVWSSFCWESMMN